MLETRMEPDDVDERAAYIVHMRLVGVYSEGSASNDSAGLRSDGVKGGVIVVDPESGEFALAVK